MAAGGAFTPALVIVDLQEDFCPPNGALAVSEGRSIAPLINLLSGLPFTARVATQDWHPADHVSFAANHPGKKPFTDSITIVNPENAAETYQSRLWPVHCVQGSHGAEIIPELDMARVDSIIQKGSHSRVEMYSAFYDPLTSPRISDSGLSAALKERGITHVYVVGLAFDYCVKHTAIDAVREGFTTYVIKECTRAVDAQAWAECTTELEKAGVVVVSAGSPEVERVRALGQPLEV